MLSNPKVKLVTDDGHYHVEGADRDADDLIAFWSDLVDRFPIVSLEDALAQDDWAGWARLTAALGDRVQLVGDDIFVTNPERLERGLRVDVAHAHQFSIGAGGCCARNVDCIAHAHGPRVADDRFPYRAS